MSRETAPHYRVHECCFYCGFAASVSGRELDCCVKHNIYFNDGESRARICDDYKFWRNPTLAGVCENLIIKHAEKLD